MEEYFSRVQSDFTSLELLEWRCVLSLSSYKEKYIIILVLSLVFLQYPLRAVSLIPRTNQMYEAKFIPNP